MSFPVTRGISSVFGWRSVWDTSASTPSTPGAVFYNPPRDLDLEDALGEPGRPFDPYDALTIYARKHDQTQILGRWTDHYLARFAGLDEKKMQQPVRQTLLELNQPSTILEWHGVYLVDQF